jgi:DNA-binding NarL/FixJ family response regulator
VRRPRGLLENPMSHTALQRSNILVMHHDPILSAGLAAVLHRHAGFEIFVDDDVDAERPQGPRVDVVVTDYEHAMHLANAAVAAARRPLAASRILAVMSIDREADIRRAIEAGIHGVLLLGCPLHDLIEGVTAVANGRRYLCRSGAQRMADSLTRTAMTSREIEVLQLVVDGESNKAIARRLSIELATVKSHMTAIMAKLDATSRTQAAGIASARGLVERHSPMHSAPPASAVAAAPYASRIGMVQVRPQFT